MPVEEVDGLPDQLDAADALEDVVGAVRQDLLTPSAEVRKSVAPNCRATASLSGFASTATIREAPAIRAPWSTLRPMPPVPMTTTVSPWPTRARLRTAPTPVSTPHPMSAADVSGISAGIGTACTAFTTVRSANEELAANW